MTRIITDSAGDITQARAAELDITVIPLTVMFGEDEYLDGVTISFDDFYARLTSEAQLPHTSQVTPAQFLAAYQEVLAAGEDAVVITISSGLSGTYESARIAKTMLAPEEQGHIWVIDSLQATIGEQLVVMEAVRLRDAGLPFEEIAKQVEALVPRTQLVGVVDTLEYLKKGGRISAAAAVAGTMLNIKPLIEIKGTEGIVNTIAKAREAKNAIKVANQCIEKFGVDYNHYVLAGHTGSDPSSLQRYLENSKDFWSQLDGPIPYSQIGATIGTHVGPGAYTIVFIKPESAAE